MSWGPQGRGCCQPVTLPRPRVLHLPVLPRHLERRASGQSPFRGEGVQPPLARGAPEAGRQRGCSQFRQVPRVLLGQPCTVGAPRSARHCGCSRARQGRRGAGRGRGPSGRRREEKQQQAPACCPRVLSGLQLGQWLLHADKGHTCSPSCSVQGLRVAFSSPPPSHEAATPKCGTW